MTTKQNLETGRCPISKLEYLKADGEMEIEGSAATIEWDVEAIEGDCSAMTINATAHCVDDLDKIISEMMKLRAMMARAEMIKGNMA